MEWVLVCEDSQIGIFTGIYEAYERKLNIDEVRIAVGEDENLRLFASYIPIAPQEEKAVKVAKTVRKLTGEENYMKLCMALSSRDDEKGQAVFRTIVLILRDKQHAWGVMNRLADANVRTVFELSRSVQNEVHHLQGFVRFEEVDGGGLFARIGPKNDVVLYLMPHFSDRFPKENFVIYDEKHHILGVHQSGCDWYLVRDFQLNTETLKGSLKEQKYSELFRHFCHTIAIKERHNEALQKNLLPLRFREYMTEFAE